MGRLWMWGLWLRNNTCNAVFTINWFDTLFYFILHYSQQVILLVLCDTNITDICGYSTHHFFLCRFSRFLCNEDILRKTSTGVYCFDLTVGIRKDQQYVSERLPFIVRFELLINIFFLIRIHYFCDETDRSPLNPCSYTNNQFTMIMTCIFIRI